MSRSTNSLSRSPNVIGPATAPRADCHDRTRHSLLIIVMAGDDVAYNVAF
jgi:hypothetical protein